MGFNAVWGLVRCGVIDLWEESQTLECLVNSTYDDVGALHKHMVMGIQDVHKRV